MVLRVCVAWLVVWMWHKFWPASRKWSSRLRTDLKAAHLIEQFVFLMLNGDTYRHNYTIYKSIQVWGKPAIGFQDIKHCLPGDSWPTFIAKLHAWLEFERPLSKSDFFSQLILAYFGFCWPSALSKRLEEQMFGSALVTPHGKYAFEIWSVWRT